MGANGIEQTTTDRRKIEHEQRKVKKIAARGIKENRPNQKECSSQKCTGEIQKNQTNNQKDLWSSREDSLKILQEQIKVGNPCIASVLVRWLARTLKKNTTINAKGN